MGLTHVTSSYLLRDILNVGRIEAVEPCDVLGEPVTYAFYGRAAFRGRLEFEPTSLACLFPTVLVLDPARIPPPKYVFAFDSGAFVGGLMDQYLHPYMPLFDFLLAPDPLSAARLVTAVFENNENYFQNRVSSSFTVPSANFEADCYRLMINSAPSGENRLDDRASTPELIFNAPIPLRDTVRAAVLPDLLATDSNIGGALRAHGVRIYDYPWTTCSRPIENHFTIRQLVQGAYGDLGWL